MSNAGQAVLGIVGGVIGFYVGGPQGAAYGFQLGLLAGSAIFPTQLPGVQGPRLGDGIQTQAVVGAPIPIVFGTQRVGGIVIWASPIREVATTEDVGAKGGPEQSQTTYSYYRSFAVLLCEGPVSGIRRIWFNGKIVYDRSSPTDSTSTNDFLEQLAATEELSQKMTVYLGTEDQMPSSVIESFEGAGNVPAYRGYAYVVFEDLELKPEDGNRIPAQMSFEVYEDGDEEDNEAEEYSNEVLYPWKVNTLDPVDDRNTMEYFSDGFETSVYNPIGSVVGPFGTPDEALAAFISAMNADYENATPLSMSNIQRVAGRQATRDEYIYPRDSGEQIYGEAESVRIHWNWTGIPPDMYGTTVVTDPSDAVYVALADSRGNAWYRTADGAEMAINYVEAIGFGSASNPLHVAGTGRTSGGLEVFFSPDIRILMKRSPSPPQDPCATDGASELTDGFCVVNGQIRQAGEWQYDSSSTYKVLAQYIVSDPTHPTVTQYPLNPCVKQGHAQYNNQDFWEAAYGRAVALGQMQSGLTYGVDYPVTQAWGYKRTVSYTTVNPTPVTLASIVSRVCSRAGQTSIDVSDLEAETTYGYTVARPMAARGAIEKLRPYGLFDIVESGVVLRFPTRGKAEVATLTDEDLGAHILGEERPPLIRSTLLQEKELPRQIRIRYQSVERDLEPGEELSPERIDTEAESVIDIEVPVAMSSERAARVAEISMRDAWAARRVHETDVDISRSALEPADCIIVPVSGRAQRVRIPAITDRLPNLRRLELLRDDDGTYVSYAVGTEITRPPQSIAFYGPADMVLLDLPPLREEDNDSGVYAALRPKIVDSDFKGATVYKSIDGGTSFSPTVTATQAVAIGELVFALDEGPYEVWDEMSELRVSLPSSMTLSSRTEEDVLAGANACAVGANGRWEVVQFRNATQLVTGVWSLTGLLRGRRGTEHNIGSSFVGDTFVMLSAGGLVRVPISIAEVHVERLFKPVAVGQSQATTAAQSFTGHGVALKPFSPVHIDGVQDDGDWTITWTRRDRLQIDYVPGQSTVMSEENEDYELEVLSSSGEVLRTLSVSEEIAIYTQEQQIADFGSVQSTLTVRVYQISTAVGRGYPGEAIL